MKRSHKAITASTSTDQFRYFIAENQWLTKLPSDLSQNWIALRVPNGRRCLLVSKNQKIILFDRHHHFVQSFKALGIPYGGNLEAMQSFLKNSRVSDSSLLKELGDFLLSWIDDIERGECILDVVYDGEKDMIYVLDVLHWRQVSFVDIAAEARLAWIQQHIIGIRQQWDAFCQSRHLPSETSTAFFKYAFPFHECVMVHDLVNEGDESDDIDGYLFYQRSSSYYDGLGTVLWAKPYMLKTLLKVNI